jgi:hypothetical protein
MFDKNKERFLTRGINNEIPLSMQIFLWERVDALSEPKDYLQIFELSEKNGMQKLIHKQEEPEYRAEYLISDETPDKAIEAKIYVVDDGEYCTMLLAEEY